MLPATGFFKNIDCPFYGTACERPYCHFKHRKKVQEPAAPSEVPTYNPTPKSQLAKSHIPISYVPDLAVRTDRNFRSSAYGYSGGGGGGAGSGSSCTDKPPTYEPTPLSVLSVGKANNNIKSSESKFSSSEDDNTDDIFESLQNEFNLIGELISDSGGDSEEINGDIKKTKEKDRLGSSENNNKLTDDDVKPKYKISGNSSSKHKSKHNGKVNETSSSKSRSVDSKRSKHRSDSSSHKKESGSSRSDSKHNSSSSSNKKDSKSSKSSSREDKKKRSRSRSRSKNKEKRKDDKTVSKNKKHESKDKGKHKHKESSKHSHHQSKTREPDKEKKSKEKSKNDEKTKKITEDSEINYSEDFYNIEEESDDTEENTLQECYKIFTEYKPTEPELFPEIRKQQTINNLQENIAVLNIGRKRVAHESADKLTSSKLVFNKPKYVPSAAQAMINRLKAARTTHIDNEQNDIMTEINKHILNKRPLETTTSTNHQITPTKLLKTSSNTKTIMKQPKPSTSSSSSLPSPSLSLVDDIISGKSTTNKPRRIAPVQNVVSIQKAKAKLQEMAKINAINAITKTASQTTQKGGKRTAHVPEYSVADVPEVLGAERSKLPVNVRSRFIAMILDECFKLYLDKEEAQQRAVNEEYKCYERCAVLVTYRNSVMLAINRLRKELQEREIQGLGPIFPGELADASKVTDSELKGRKFYEHVKRFVLNKEELVLHGFPREGSVPGRAVIKNQKCTSKGYLSEHDRVCCRCLKPYKVDEDGFAIYDEECLYHPLKKRTFRGESIYLCCKSGEDTGCVTAVTHVSETVSLSDGEIEGYQMTMPPERKDDPRSYEVFALDCEMCYTTKGLELTRVTIINSELKTVYETLVKPLNAIIDYNTRFSGITEEQMNRTATSILQVQANILHLCNSETILIGHSLESDMKALKIIHNTIADTSVLFPHKFGLPHKRALRDLAREYLKKIIQNDISGHDSAEDAVSCMELVQWKIKEELKVRGIKV